MIKRNLFILFSISFIFFNANAQNIKSFHDFFENRIVHIQSAPVDAPAMGVFSGTGFIIQNEKHRYLITNYHVIDDKDYYSGVAHTPRGPYVLIIVTTSCESLNSSQFVIKIRDESKNYFHRNKYKGNWTDLVAIKIPDTLDLCVKPVIFEEYRKYKKHILDIGSEVFIYGFPSFQDHEKKSMLLLAKTITSPSTDFVFEKIGQLPLIKISKAGINGMSGSPVFKYISEKNEFIFVGVYSASDEQDRGIFWRPDILSDLINSIPDN